MDEEIEIINRNTRIEKLKNFLISKRKQIISLTIYKKGLFNSEFVQENELLSILNPIIKSESMWKPQALYLMAEYYLSKDQKQKSKDFFDQILNIENISPKIKLEVQKRLRSEFSE